MYVTICVYVCMHVCMYVCMYVCMCVRMQFCICVYVCTSYLCVCINLCIVVYDMHIYILCGCMLQCTGVHTNVRVCSRSIGPSYIDNCTITAYPHFYAKAYI